MQCKKFLSVAKMAKTVYEREMRIASSCDASENFISSGSHLGRLCCGLCLYNTRKQASSKYSPKGLIYFQVSFGHGQAIPGSAFKYRSLGMLQKRFPLELSIT